MTCTGNLFCVVNLSFFVLHVTAKQSSISANSVDVRVLQHVCNFTKDLSRFLVNNTCLSRCFLY